MEDKNRTSEEKLNWNTPTLTIAEVNHDTADSGGSMTDGLSGSLPI